MNDSIRPATYREEVTKYTKKDGIYALLYAGYILLLFSALVFVDTVFGLIDFDNNIQNLLFRICLVPLFLAPIFVILKKKGQKIRSVGLHLTDWKKALCMGLFCVAVFLMLHDGLLPGLLGGWQFNPPAVIVLTILPLLIMAALEDIAFIGFIQTRIYGLIKNNILAVVLVGFIFAALHYPSLISMNIENGGTWGGAFLGQLALATSLFIGLHAFMNAIFRKYRSIIAVTLCHFAWNFATTGGLWEDVGEGGFDPAFSGGIGIWVILMAMFFVFPFFGKRKAAK